MPPERSDDDDPTRPLTHAPPHSDDNHDNHDHPDDHDDLDASGLIGPSSPHVPPDALLPRFALLWRRVPSSWSVERDPRVALTQLLTLAAFISLCVFVFSVPAVLHAVAPRAPAPPGTSPDLDQAASMLSGTRGAVAADHPTCSDLGVTVLRDLHGNAVDAMVAAVLCQGVLSPFASGMGGGAFILVHSAQRAQSSFYDAREVAPAAARMRDYRRNATVAKFGGLAVAVPGELRGLYQAHQEWGALNWSAVVQPAVKVAESATVGKYLAIKLKQMNETVMSSPSLREVFTKRVPTKRAKEQSAAEASVELPGVRQAVEVMGRGVADTTTAEGELVTDANDQDKHGVTTEKGAEDDSKGDYTVELLEEGDRIVNDALVQTLKRVAEKGPDALYVDMSGKLAKEIQAAGGIVTSKDIRTYKALRREPVRGRYHEFDVIGAPLPSAGGVSIAMALNMIREMRFRRKGRNSMSYKLLTETLKYVFGARMGLGDPMYVAGADRQMWRMMSRREAVKRVFRINDRRTYGPKHYSSRVTTSRLEDGTSHVSILDSNGTGVSVTSTINLPFGAGLLSNSTGILLNDEMDAFTTSTTRTNAFGLYPSAENGVEGGKRSISSMSPTILLSKGRVYMVVGGSGGPKAVSGVLQTILNVVDFGDWIADAISAPRLHHQLIPNEVSLEGADETTCEQSHALQRPSGGNGATGSMAWSYWSPVCKALKQAGHTVTGPAVHGAVQAVVAPDALVSPWRLKLEDRDGRIYAASDPRRIGKAAAY